jgi:RNA polymerase sigma-70 factor (ECF subfamily)
MQWTDVVAAAVAEGQQAYPTVSIEAGRFGERLQQVGVTASDLAAHARDLYLASACADGDPEAVRIFEAAYIASVDVYIARSGVPASWTSEVKQKVRLKLLVGRNPGIGRYRGEGPLTALVRVTAVRVAVDVATAAADHRSDGEALNLLVSSDANPEVETAIALYRDRFREAVEESLTSLSAREKTLLRLHFVDGLNIDGMGAIYRVHRATVARWLVAVRERVLTDLRKRLAIALGGTPSEMRSLVRLLRDDIQVSARRILGDDR